MRALGKAGLYKNSVGFTQHTVHNGSPRQVAQVHSVQAELAVPEDTGSDLLEKLT
jgi:hypothetical protein